MVDLLTALATLATALLLGNRLYRHLDARWETERPYWDDLRQALSNESVTPPSNVPASRCAVVVRRPPFDWDDECGRA